MNMDAAKNISKNVSLKTACFHCGVKLYTVVRPNSMTPRPPPSLSQQGTVCVRPKVSCAVWHQDIGNRSFKS